MALPARLALPRPVRSDWPYHQTKTVILPVSTLLSGDRRMEAETYLASGYGFRIALEAHSHGWVALSKYANIWQPGRTKGILVSPEYGTPFLAATQVFDLRPVPRKWLALERTSNAASLFVQPGAILVTRSGAVGRATLAYTPHTKTLISDDLLRIEPREHRYWGWIYAYLRTPTARAMMTSAQYGHVIKHLEVSHLNALPIPEISDDELEYFNEQARAVLNLREQAHAATLTAEERFEQCVGPLPPIDNGENGFAVQAQDAFFKRRRRMDGWRHSPLVIAIRQHLVSRSLGVATIREAGYRVWVPGRYKRIPAEDGVTFLDSSDLFEINPDLVKQFADCQFGDEYRGRVERGWLLMASSGQTYGIVGGTVLANDFYSGKVVANHVIRIAPTDNSSVRAGYLAVVMAHPRLGRPLIKSFAFGSSVPEIDPDDVNEFPIVRLAQKDENAIADLAEQAAEWRAEADLRENALADEAEGILSRFIAAHDNIIHFPR